jgi:hypothetical protein
MEPGPPGRATRYRERHGLSIGGVFHSWSIHEAERWDVRRRKMKKVPTRRKDKKCRGVGAGVLYNPAQCHGAKFLLT